MENVLFWIIFGVTQIARASGDICFNFDRDFTYIEFECDDGCCGTDSMNQECCDKKCCGKECCDSECCDDEDAAWLGWAIAGVVIGSILTISFIE
ncbi:uncharacterized protein LOC132720982 isoform X3 [Ruditapes philippinarum]|uniref:uncharacterized protein LOC132720982 isoform X3 n=1 Tax=Ruditapes philippinarum TaxID=129788 RepID=UPI00295BBCEF|nr:uncharacterized protein LOC132720982 isoform X3 [Ruditapes philippinarum]